LEEIGMSPRILGSALLGAIACGCAGRQPVAAPAQQAPPAQVAAPAAAPASQPEAVATSAPQASAIATPEATFDASIKPILVQNCMPCHFPGGKMYERLPFDDPTVVRSHPEGVLRRLKDPETRLVVERWIGR